MSGASTNLQLVVRNALRLASGSVMMQALSFVSGILLTRHFQASGYGQYAFSVAYAWFFNLFIAFGTRGTLLRDVPRQPKKGGHYISQIALFRCVTASIALAGALLIGMPLDKSPEVLMAMILLVLQAATDSIFFLISDLFRCFEDMRHETRLYTLERALSTAGIALAAWQGWSLVAIVQMMVGCALFRSLLFVRLLRAHVTLPPLRVDWDFWRYLLRESIPFLLVDLTLAVSMRVDILLLSIMRSDQEVGYYNAAYNIVLNMLVLPTVLIGAMQPTTARLSQEDHHEMVDVKVWLMRSVLMLLLLPIACIAGVAPALMTTLFGPSFAAGGPILRLLMACLPAMILSGMAGNYFFSTDRQMIIFKVTFAAAATNLLLNLLLIPTYGATGSAMATLVAEGGTTVALLYLCRESFGKRVAQVAPALIMSSLATFAVVSFGYSWLGWPVLGLGCLIYGLALVLTGGLRRDDWQGLCSLRAMWGGGS